MDEATVLKRTVWTTEYEKFQRIADIIAGANRIISD